MQAHASPLHVGSQLLVRTLVVAFLLGGCGPAENPAQPTATPLPAPTAAPTEPPTRALRATFDDLTTRQLQVGATTNATFRIDSGRYLIEVRQPNAQVWSSFGDIFGDGTVEVDLRFHAGSPPLAAGLMFRIASDQQFYLASLSSDGFYALDVREPNGWRSLIEWTRDPAIDGRGGTNRLKIVTRGDVLSLYLNDILLSQTTDSAFVRGRLALSVITYDQAGISVDFDNLVVEP